MMDCRCMWSDQFISTQDPLAVPIDFREDLFKEASSYRIGSFAFFVNKYLSVVNFHDDEPPNKRSEMFR